MSEHDQSRKFADKSAASANDVLQAAVERSAQAIEQSHSATVERMRDYNQKMIEVAQANTHYGLFAKVGSNPRPNSMPVAVSPCRRQRSNRGGLAPPLHSLIIGEAALTNLLRKPNTHTRRGAGRRLIEPQRARGAGLPYVTDQGQTRSGPAE
jgi:hypothetical protein